MKWQWWAVPALLTLGTTTPGGCSYLVCMLGTVPVDGSTNVDPEIILELHTFDLSRDSPSLDGVVTLEKDGEPVDIDVLVDPESQTVFVTPLEPLQPGVYEFYGAESANTAHWYEGFGPSNPYADIQFEVGGEPAFWDAGLVDKGATLLVAFSEPVQPDTVADALVVETKGAFAVLGARNGDARVVEVHLTVAHPSGVRISVGDGVLAEDGTPVRGTVKPLWADEGEGLGIEARLGGEGYCG